MHAANDVMQPMQAASEVMQPMQAASEVMQPMQAASKVMLAAAMQPIISCWPPSCGPALYE